MKIRYSWLLLGPYLLFALGFAMNALVMAVNGGQMPVQFPGGYPTDRPEDFIHVAMTVHTHLKFLADWVVIRNFGVASPGDFLEFQLDVTQGPSLFMWIALILKND